MVPFAAKSMSEEKHTVKNGASPGLQGRVRTLTLLEERWLSCVGHMAAAGKQEAEKLSGKAAARVVHGRGAGGDRTLEIDQVCETVMLAVLEREAPAPYLVVSEEAGVLGAQEAAWRVVVDPVDGSLNAKRGLAPFAASIAVAGGDTIKDVEIGYVEEYTRPRYFAAVKGAGLVVADPAGNGRWLAVAATSQTATEGLSPQGGRLSEGRVEVVLLEASRPDRHHFSYRDLGMLVSGCSEPELRVRQIGSLALSLCYVAVGIADVLVAAVPSRSVDVAAGLRILAEAGGGAMALNEEDLWDQPLDLEKRCAFVAWRAGLETAELLERSRQLAKTLIADLT